MEGGKKGKEEVIEGEKEGELEGKEEEEGRTE